VARARSRKQKNKSRLDGFGGDSGVSSRSGFNDLCVGVVVGAQGLKGAIRIKPFTDQPSRICVFESLVTESGVSIALRQLRVQKGIVVAQIDGVSDRTAAEAWVGKRLYVLRSTLPKLEPEEYYRADLIGLRVDSQEGAWVGTVIAVHDFGAGGIIEVETGGGANMMVPFTARTVAVVDMVNGRLVLASEAFEWDEKKS